MTPFERAVADGFSVFCASCEHHHTSRALGNLTCGRPHCGSVLRGMAFPEYKGPLRKDALCFVCGAEVQQLVRDLDSLAELGLCEAHLPMLQTSKRRFVLLHHGRVRLVQYPGPSRFARLVEEVETYYARKDAERVGDPAPQE